jgi:hypothetical protein
LGHFGSIILLASDSSQKMLVFRALDCRNRTKNDQVIVVSPVTLAIIAINKMCMPIYGHAEDFWVTLAQLFYWNRIPHKKC